MNGQLQVRSLGCQILHEKVDVRRTDQVAVIGWVKQRRRQYLREPRGRPLRLGRGLAKAHFNSASVGALCLRKAWQVVPPTTPYPPYGPGYDHYCDCGSTLER